ncbi:MAG TPA: PAS domain S-box protein [Smithellaceae bacterium]|nr:PAS domain S-box protein [Smithellaceae bacterium]HPY06876.1 PAS domain S-box protein [Smithellaceae bacterium]
MTKEELLKEMDQMRKSMKRLQKSEASCKEAADLFRKREQEYREMVELANSIILRMDTSGRIVFVNDFALRFFGFSKEEIVGKNLIGTIVPKMESSGRDLAAFMVSVCRNPGEHTVNENENIKKDGSRVWILWTNRPVLDERGRLAEIICIGNDVTQKKEAEQILQNAHDELEKEVRERTKKLQKLNEDLLFEMAERKISEEALKESENRYRNIVESAFEGIFQTTLEGKCTMVNSALVALLGYSSAEEYIAATARPENLYVDASRREELIRILQTDGYVKGFETEFYRKDGSKLPVSMNVRAVFDDRGNFIYYQGTVIDISAGITLRRVLDETTGALSTAVEIRDPYTAGHQERVTRLAEAIAAEMNFSDERISAVHTAGMLHDIGKIYVPAEFLSRPGKITDNEYNILKQHAQEGYEILKSIEYKYPIAEIVYQHHERINGSGYPRKLSGDRILIEARIISVADVVEAMASPRPYRPALGIDKALDEIRKNRGILYDENVVDACLTLFQDKGFQFGGGVTGFDATAGKEQPRNRSVSQDWSETIFKGRP